MSDLTEIKGLIEQINPTLVTLRSEVDALKASQPTDVVTEEKHQRMAADITAKMADLQKKQAAMEAAMKRPGTGNDAGALEAEHKAKFDAFAREGVSIDGKMSQRPSVEIKAMATPSQPDGGYLVRPALANFVMDRVIESSPVRLVARVETGSTKSIEILIDDDTAGAEWVSEGATLAATDTPQLGQKDLVAHKMHARPSATDEMLQDAYLDVESWIGRHVADEFGRLEATAFVNGNGVGRPRGFMTYAAWSSAGVYERDKIEQINMLNASALTAEGFIKVQWSLKEPYQSRAVWAMKRATYGAAISLKGADQFFFGPLLLKDGQATATLLGKRVVFMDDMAAVGAGNLAVAYGDFSRGYTIYQRAILQIIRDPFTSPGRVVFQTFRRVGGDVTNFDAIKIGKVAS
jgi:HK97 family phage major capsid protein